MGTISKGKLRRRLLPSSSQLKTAVCYILAITAALIVLNVYTSSNARTLLFRSRYSAMQSKAQLISSSLSGMEYLTSENVRQVIGLLGGNESARLIVTDEAGWLLYDSLEQESARQRLAMLPEVYLALNGRDIFHCSYSRGVTECFCAAPVMYYDAPVGAVYLMEREQSQSMMIAMLEFNVFRISLILEAVVILVAILFATVFSLRMQTILQTIPKIRDGEYGSRIELGGHDELTTLADEFNKMTEKLADSESVRRRFVSDASHELKTPLASIKLLSETILQNELDREMEREFVADICSESERLNRMTQKLLQLSRMDSVREEEREVVVLGYVVEKVYRMLRPHAQERSIELCANVSLDCSVLATEDDMYQICFNLVENAIKYNVEGGSVCVTAALENEDVVMTVEDTGVGIPEAERAHIFERFYRVDKARSRAAGGAGLGLSIVHDMVERNFGTIRVEPGAPRGSRFVLTFPYFGIGEDTV